jgi:hypothetical protein
MRNFIRILAAASVVLPLTMACNDDPDEDNNNGGTSNQGGEGGSSAGKSGGGGKGGSGGKSGSGGKGGGDEGGAGAVSQGGGGAGPGETTCDFSALEDGGKITADIGTLESGKSYLLEGLIKIEDSLTIEPCVQILGDEDTLGTLVVLPGATITAEGEEDAPIVFTSAADVGDRAPGQWGGVIILGNGVCNDATDDAPCQIEGLTDGTTYGNTAAEADNEESSGSLKYVRIEYPGVDLDGQGNEINGLTLGGVGSGTTISHVMVANTLDDCFEWFGGAVKADHLIAHNCGDDMFDVDSGFSGQVQFAFGKQVAPITGDPSSGFEWDTDKTVFDKAPVTAPEFANITLCGTGDAAPVTGTEIGLVLRRGVAGSITNALVTGFASSGLSFRNAANTATTVTSSLIFGNIALVDADHEGGEAWFTDETTNSVTEPEDFGDCFAAEPAPFPAEAIAGGTPTGFADETAEYVGAFENADGNWMTGAWVDWATE